jgi:predicted small lipoprotein YifL
MRKSLLVALLLLSGCGLKGDLKPVPPQGPPPVPFGETTSPTPAEMLVRQPQAAPLRVDDPVKRSEERPEDRFNLPPPKAMPKTPPAAPAATTAATPAADTPK